MFTYTTRMSMQRDASVPRRVVFVQAMRRVEVAVGKGACLTSRPL